ncbi:bifunctional enoyl-CoA hydratase/phosphate acetyltransferase [Candidatus Riflebacteria bacterium]
MRSSKIFTTYQDIRDAAFAKKGKKIVVVLPYTTEAVESIDKAYKKGLASGVFVGDAEIIKEKCRQAGVKIENHQLIDIPDEAEARVESVRLIRAKEADILMKGSTSTGPFMKSILDRENGIREGGLISHVMVTKAKRYHKLLLISDAGICIAPDLKQKKMIIENAVAFAKKLGIQTPKVAIVCALEKVNPDMPATIDAAELARMNERDELTDCIVEGPYALDNALSKECAELKGIKGKVIGDADILIVPDIEAGNIFAKSIFLLADAEYGGILVGTTAPVALLSRADDEVSKENTIALAVAVS